MNVAPLRGLPGYFAYQAYLKFLFGLKHLPMYIGENFTNFVARVSELDDDGKAAVIREALGLVDLIEVEIENLTRFVKDPNGVPYTKENMASLDPLEVFEILFAVCMACAKIKDRGLTTPDEKKNLKISQ